MNERPDITDSRTGPAADFRDRQEARPNGTAPGTQVSHGGPSLVGLDAVPAGASATICEMNNGDHALIARVKAIGLFPGSRVRVLRQGRRIVVSGERTRIALSHTVCQHIRVILEENLS